MFGDLDLKQDDGDGLSKQRWVVRIGSNGPNHYYISGSLILELYTNLKLSVARPNKSSKN
jgi:hypothetical protein